MNSKMRLLRQRARQAGLDIAGPYFGDVYALLENSSGDLLADRQTADEVRAEVEKQEAAAVAGLVRLADARRRRAWR